MAKEAVSVVVVTYESAQYIKALADSVRAQSYPIAEVVVVDNSLGSETIDALKQSWPEARVVHSGSNLDWCKGANLGIRESVGEYVFLINPDMKLAKDATEHLMRAITEDELVGAVAPKLLRMQEGPKPILDGMGITISRGRRFTNRGEGELDTGQYDSVEPFGFSGAATMYRRGALVDLAEHGGGEAQEYYDEDFVAYKDDVDVSYRLRHRGWKLALVPAAVAYHARTAKELRSSEGLKADRRAKSLRIRGNSWRNHFWTLVKNEPFSSLLPDFPWIFGYELLKFVYILVREPSTLRSLPSAVLGFSRMLRKRRAILTSSRISGTTLREIIQNS